MAEDEENGAPFKAKRAEWISAEREKRRAKNLAREGQPLAIAIGPDMAN